MDFQEDWKLGRWSGIDVYLHWTALLVFPWLLLWFHSAIFAAIGTVGYVILHLVHEWGHVFMARRRRLYVTTITLRGLHSHTELGTHGTHKDQMLVAWGGVLAQALLLVASYALAPFLWHQNNWLLMLAGPLLFMFTEWNIFLMVVALLPIGPMDGHLAWAAIPMLRKNLRKRWQQHQSKRKRKRSGLALVEPQQLDKKSETVAADIIRKISRAD